MTINMKSKGIELQILANLESNEPNELIFHWTNIANVFSELRPQFQELIKTKWLYQKKNIFYEKQKNLLHKLFKIGEKKISFENLLSWIDKKILKIDE